MPVVKTKTSELIKPAFDVPPAPLPLKAWPRGASKFFEQQAKQLTNRIPVYTWQEIQIFRQNDGSSIYDILTRKLHEQGYHNVADEMHAILQADKAAHARAQLQASANGSKVPVLKLLRRPSALKLLTETLQRCEDLMRSGAPEESIVMRKELAITFADMKDYWLSEYLLQKCLQIIDMKSMDSSKMQRILAEIHILIAYVAGFMAPQGSEELLMDDRINHVIKCRQLIGKEKWSMKTDVVKVALSKPKTTGGFDNVAIVINSRAVSMGRMAALLEISLLMEKATYILNSSDVPSEESVSLAVWYAKEALRRAREILDVGSLKIALIHNGIISIDCGFLQEAMDCFRLLAYIDEGGRDQESRAIAYQGVAETLTGKPDIRGALDSYLLACEVPAASVALKSEILVQIAMILLQEGHTVEAEEGMKVAIEILQTDETTNFSRNENTLIAQWMQYMWAFHGIANAESCWNRLVTFARFGSADAIKNLCAFKTRRLPLLPGKVPPLVIPMYINQVFDLSYLRKPVVFNITCPPQSAREASLRNRKTQQDGSNAYSTSTTGHGPSDSVSVKSTIPPLSRRPSKMTNTSLLCEVDSTVDTISSSGRDQSIYDYDVNYMSDMGQRADFDQVRSSAIPTSGSGSKSTLKSSTNTSGSTNKQLTISSDSNSLERFSRRIHESNADMAFDV